MTLDAILRKSQPELKRCLCRELSMLGYKPKSWPGFLYAKGTLPVLLVAHLDTVHHTGVKTICTSRDGNVLMSPEGIGGDDRAGVYMILQLVKKHHCHVLFCEDEEIGAIGARSFVRSKLRPEVNYIVELDRRGANDAVFYDCDNPVFTEFICGFGFVESFGTFSDISILAPYLGVAAVNISAGYHEEHTKHEYINLLQVKCNIGKVERMLETQTGKFEYIESTSRLFGAGFVRSLAPVPSDGYLATPEGDLFEIEGSLLMDEFGSVYETYDMDTAVALEGFSVYSAQGVPAKFDAEKSSAMIVMSEDYYM